MLRYHQIDYIAGDKAYRAKDNQGGKKHGRDESDEPPEKIGTHGYLVDLNVA